MKRLLWTLLALLVGGPVLAACPAGSTCQTFAAFTSGVASASALAGTELFPCIQSAATVSCTPAQLKTYVGNPAFSAIGAGTNANALVIGTGGSLTISGSGTINATTLGSATFAAPGPIGSGTASTGAFTTLSASSTVSGTGFSTYLASPPAIGGTAAAAGKFTTLQATGGLTTNVTGSTQCLHVDTTGLVSGTGSDCGSGGSTAFSAISPGTNAGALLMGTGGSLSTSGSGTIAATSVTGLSVTAAKTLTVSNSLTLAGTDATTMTFPGTSQAVAGLAAAQTWTAAQTYTNSDLLLLGSSTGATTFASANAGASNFTLTFPAVTDTLATIGAAQTWTAAQTFTNSDIKLLGSSTGATTLTSDNAGASNFTLHLPAANDTLGLLGTAQTYTAAKTFTNSDLLLLGSSTGATTFTSDNAGASNFTMHVPAANDTLVTLAASQTLTSKTLTTPTVSTLTLSDVASGTQCLHANSSGVVSGAGGDCATASTSSYVSFATGTQAQATTGYDWYNQNSASSAGVGGLSPVTGHVKNLYYAAANASAAGQSFTATVYIGTVGSPSSTALTCTATAAKICNDTADSVAVTAGQQITLQVVTSATSGSTGVQFVGLEIVSP